MGSFASLSYLDNIYNYDYDGRQKIERRDRLRTRAPMEMELPEAELQLFTVEEDQLVDIELGVEVIEEEEKEEEMCEEERSMKRKWAREDEREDRKAAKRRKIAEEEDKEKALPDRVGVKGKDKGGQSEMNPETTARNMEKRLGDKRSGLNPTLGNEWKGEGASWEGAAGRLGTSVAQWDEVRAKKRMRELRRIEEGKFTKRMKKSGAQKITERKRRLREEAVSAAAPSGSTTTPPGQRIEPKSTPRMNLTEEVKRMEAPAKKASRTMFSGAPRNQQQQQHPPPENSRPAAIIDYEALMRKQEAQLSRFKKGSNGYKVQWGKLGQNVGRWRQRRLGGRKRIRRKGRRTRGQRWRRRRCRKG